MASVSDGWGAPYDDQTYVDAYEQLEIALLEKLDRQLPKADLEKFRPKFKNHQKTQNSTGIPGDVKSRRRQRTDDEYRDLMYNCGTETEESEFEDHERKRNYFRPPLQIQRNAFVKNQLMRFKKETNSEIRRLGVMGCGEMSLEKSMCEYLGAFGTINVLSVDIDEESVSVGQQLLEKHVTENADVLATETGLPVLMRSYIGDILVPDHRFGDLDAIVSLEVVEHIPLSDAKKFVANVLGILMPRVFIFSTPNHEFNKVFGMEPGEFRHDDHKFEMTRKEFSEWLQELSIQFPHFEIDDPYYIGMTKGFEELQGASQAAICRLRMDYNTTIPMDVTPYEMVGHLPCRLGTRLVTYNLVKQAFLEWIEKTEFRETELIPGPFQPLWIFNVANILHHIHAPLTFASTIDEKVAIKYIQGMTNLRVSSEFSHGFNGIAITRSQTKAEIIEQILKNSNF